jgi:phosphoribosylformylglycinamidine synthase
MLITVPENYLKEVLEIFVSEDVEATNIGFLSSEQVLMLSYDGNVVAEIDMEFLFNPPKVQRRAEWEKTKHVEPSFVEPEGLTDILFDLLSSPNIASKEAVIRSYDHEVKGNTVLKPLCGKFAGPSDAAVIKPLDNSNRGLVISCGMNPQYGKIDTYWMAASNIDEAIRNNIAVGGQRIALLDNFVWGSPEKPDRMGSLVKACEACYDFAKGFETPFISGKDSLYNESPLGPVTPTLLITAIGIISDVKKTVSMDLKTPGNLIYLVGQTYPELGGSEYYRMKGFIGRTVPLVRLNEANRTMDSVSNAIEAGYVRACHDLSEGGLAVAAAEMAFSSGLGLDVWLNNFPQSEPVRRNDYVLFSESNSRFLIEVPEKMIGDFEATMKGANFAQIGRIKKEKFLSIHGLGDETVIEADLDDLRDAWKKTFGG